MSTATECVQSDLIYIPFIIGRGYYCYWEYNKRKKRHDNYNDTEIIETPEHRSCYIKPGGN